MKRMSYLLLCAAIVFVTACSDDDTRQAAAKKELSMIVPQNNNASKVLLLKDGSLANPVSGIPDFNSRTTGSKLLVTYRPLKTENGITNIEVTSFLEADDSTFTVDPIVNIADSVYQNSFSGSYFITNQDSTFTYTGDVTLEFSGAETSTYSYTLTPSEGAIISGTGSFTINEEGAIIFENNEDAGTIVPIGEFSLSYSGGWLYFWSVREDDFYSYALSKD